MTIESSTSWTFLSNHAHVLICLARDADLRMRDVAEQVGITERAVQGIVRDLVDGGTWASPRLVVATLQGAHAELRHTVEGRSTIGDLLALANHGRQP